MKVTRNIQIGISSLICGLCFVLLSQTAEAQVLTIGSGSTFTINGGTLDVNCLGISVMAGGSLLLQNGTIYDSGGIIVAATGIYDKTGGTVSNCSGGGGNVIIIPLPNTGLVIPVVIPQ